jgi:hypothetical protein
MAVNWKRGVTRLYVVLWAACVVVAGTHLQSNIQDAHWSYMAQLKLLSQPVEVPGDTGMSGMSHDSTGMGIAESPEYHAPAPLVGLLALRWTWAGFGRRP